MVKNINKNIDLLKIKSKDATKEDINVAIDLIDTLKFNSSHCVGMAANMIGINKNIIVINDNNEIIAMINPKITSKSGEYVAVEGCLSLDGVRKTLRHKRIKVSYYDLDFNKHSKEYKDFTAQIIEHEVDHLFGIII